MAKPKNIDNIEMSFTDNPNATDASQPKPQSGTAPAATASAPEDLDELKENGQLVYQKNKKTGEIKFFIQKDGKDQEVDIGVIDKLESAYRPIPETSFNGGEKKGALQVRFVAEKFNKEKKGMETVEVPFEECQIVSERQEYEDGEIVTNSITKEHYNLVKLLRGEIGAKKEENK